MHFHPLSDLHHEFGIPAFTLPEHTDVFIIAGDLDTGIKGITWLKETETLRHLPIIYILGNHEYYRGSYPKTLHKIKEAAAGTNIHILENESITLGEVTFHGATLWTDFQLFGGDPSLNGTICQERMNDYRLIRLYPSYSKLRSVDTFTMHKISLRWLAKSLKNSPTRKNIVITHHAPSIQSIPSSHKNDPMSSAYASSLEAFILEYQPDYWIHGHIHTPADYTIGNTRVICNPRGYIHDSYNHYDPNLILEI